MVRVLSGAAATSRRLGGELVPHTAAVLAQHLDAVPPAAARTVTPAEVRERIVANG